MSSAGDRTFNPTVTGRPGGGLPVTWLRAARAGRAPSVSGTLGTQIAASAASIEIAPGLRDHVWDDAAPAASTPRWRRHRSSKPVDGLSERHDVDDQDRAGAVVDRRVGVALAAGRVGRAADEPHVLGGADVEDDAARVPVGDIGPGAVGAGRCAVGEAASAPKTRLVTTSEKGTAASETTRSVPPTTCFVSEISCTPSVGATSKKPRRLGLVGSVTSHRSMPVSPGGSPSRKQFCNPTASRSPVNESVATEMTCMSTYAKSPWDHTSPCKPPGMPRLPNRRVCSPAALPESDRDPPPTPAAAPTRREDSTSGTPSDHAAAPEALWVINSPPRTAPTANDFHIRMAHLPPSAIRGSYAGLPGCDFLGTPVRAAVKEQ